MAEVSQARPAPAPAPAPPRRGRPCKYIIDDTQPMTAEEKKIIRAREYGARKYARNHDAIVANMSRRQKEYRAKFAENVKMINELKLQLAAAQ